jgi:hypothetical protein
MEALYQAYGLAEFHSNDGKVIPDVTWSDDGDRTSLVVSNKIVTREIIQKAVKKGIKKLSSLLDRLLLGFPSAQFIPETIHDDHNKTDFGYCFIDDPRNARLKVGSKALLEFFLKDPEYSQGGVLDPIACQRWISNAAEALKLLCFLIHTTCGQPGRATEVSCLQFRNSEQSRRHFFFHKNRLLVRPSYNKTDAKMQKGKFILRFFEAHVRGLFIQYVSFVRPLEV